MNEPTSWRVKRSRERERGKVECVPRHNDYIVLGKQKGWRGNSQECGRTWGLDRGRKRKRRGYAYFLFLFKKERKKKRRSRKVIN